MLASLLGEAWVGEHGGYQRGRWSYMLLWPDTWTVVRDVSVCWRWVRSAWVLATGCRWWSDRQAGTTCADGRMQGRSDHVCACMQASKQRRTEHSMSQKGEGSDRRGCRVVFHEVKVVGWCEACARMDGAKDDAKGRGSTAPRVTPAEVFGFDGILDGRYRWL